MDISGAFGVCLVWIAACSIAGLACLGLIWLGMKLFFNSESETGVGPLERRMKRIESRIDELELEVYGSTREEN